ncbi:MAG: hypothetical protein HYT83_00035 [Candidatus Levybacteria bacterium]|nr:hypothetical protein [Candidatus Levybacteria bacterium]
MSKKKLSERSKHISKKASFYILVVVAGVISIILVSLVSINTTKQSSLSLDNQNVLGNYAISSCSYGDLTTSTNKVFQVLYPTETFQQLTNIDLFKDVSQLKNLTCLQYLDATDRTVKGDIANLKNLTNLEVFTLFSNPEVYGHICSLSGARNLRSLKFAFDPKITGDIACLKNLTKLETFAMTHTAIWGDLSVFANMPNLKALYINGTKIKGNICSLSKLTNLEELGIADEVGNRDITGDLACLDSLQKLKRVSLYNTSATNCDEFTKSHRNIAQMGQTQSGRPSGGGCSKESQKTLVNVAQTYEKKIGKEEEDRGFDNYKKDAFSDLGEGSKENDEKSGEPNKGGNFFANIFDSFKNLLSRLPLVGNIIGGKLGSQARPDLRQGGPGGCKSQAECESFCSKSENRETCSKFAPPDKKGAPTDNLQSEDQEPRSGPGGCKSKAECQAYCSKPENQQECSKFPPPGEENNQRNSSKPFK